jgi:ribonuclease HII
MKIMTGNTLKRPRPDRSIERGFQGRVAGLDEVGRGPLAGPVVAACVVLPKRLPAGLADLLDDSKMLSPAARDAAYAALLASGAQIGVGAANVAEILQINILHASMLAMRRAFARLDPQPNFALVDGNREPGLPCPTQTVVGGDGISLSIAAASIVAKVVRDRAMARLHQRHSAYGWATNAGYGTRIHLEALIRLGPTHHHRTAFGTVRRLLEAMAANPSSSVMIDEVTIDVASQGCSPSF